MNNTQELPELPHLRMHEAEYDHMTREHVVQPVGNLAVQGVLQPTGLAIRELTEAANLANKHRRLETIAASINYIQTLRKNEGPLD